MKRRLLWAMGGTALAAMGVALFLQRQEDHPDVSSTPAAPSVVAESNASTAASEPAIKYPIAAPQGASSLETTLDLTSSLDGLFGHTTVLSWFQLQDFPRRFVATVDNLGRSQASPNLWPLNPVGGRFLTLKRASGEVIDPDNGVRYAPYLQLLEKIDLPQAVSLYSRLYPVFQREYVDLGYPKGNFNDRLVEVIDQLLGTPESDTPLSVHLPSIKDSIQQPARPWVLYELDDASLQSLSAGQRILLRMGPVNERRVKARLAEVRHLLTHSQGKAGSPIQGTPQSIMQRKGAPNGAPK